MHILYKHVMQYLLIVLNSAANSWHCWSQSQASNTWAWSLWLGLCLSLD